MFFFFRREQVSQVLGADEKAPLPKDNVFAVQNYHQESSAQDPGELLDHRHHPVDHADHIDQDLPTMDVLDHEVKMIDLIDLLLCPM